MSFVSREVDPEARPLVYPVARRLMAEHTIFGTLLPEHERRQHRVSVGGVGEHHQKEETDEDELELGLDHPVAVAAEEWPGDSWQGNDEHHGDNEKDRKPEAWLDEDRRQRDAPSPYR